MSDDQPIETADDEDEFAPNPIQARAMEWFSEKVVDPACPACKQEAWLISSTLHTYPAYDPATGGVFFEDGLTSVVFICGSCAFMRAFNASVMDIAE